MKTTLNKIYKALTGRLAKNIYLWLFLGYVVFDMNYNNEHRYHHGIIYSPWYYWFIITGFLLQMTLVYVNNLWLCPKYLHTRRYGRYALYVSVLVFVISLAYTIGVKIAGMHFDVDHVQQAGFVTSPVTKGWTFEDLLTDMQTYTFGNASWVFIFTMAWYMQDYARQRRAAEQAEKKQVEAELNFLKNQINPHFLFNTLNNLYGLALKHSENAPGAILKLSSILRYLLYESNTPMVSFEKEKEIMQAYIELELLRITDSKGLHFSVSADGPDYSIPPLLWMPVLENLFKHGTRIITNDMRGDFEFAITDNRLTISSTNNYKGAVQINGSKKEGGIGLTNLTKRLELLYPKKYKIEQHKDDQDYSIEVKIDL